MCAGDIIAGPHVRDACARHLRDLEHGYKRGLTWHPELAERAYRFFQVVLRLNGGEHEGKPFILEPWQRFIVGSVFGWLNVEGYRRFRVAFCETAKGSGKSPLAAGIGMYMMTADNEPRAEIYAAATKKDQAMILFRDAVAMVDQSPTLSSKLTKSGSNPVWNLAYLPTGSFFRPISSDDGQSGPRPHCALLDEIHEHKTPQVVEMVRAGTKGRRQALIFMITNSGVDRASVCYEYHDYGAKVCAGELEDDSLFAYICAVDEGDDPITDEPDPELGYPRSWAKANPSIGVTFPPRYLEEQVAAARGMPSKESIVRRLNFCQWVDAANPWIDGDLWRACEGEAEPDPDTPVYLGLDLSSNRDLTAMAAAWREGERICARLWYWTPADTLEERSRTDHVPYRAWVDAGHLNAVPGRWIDYGHVVQFIKEELGHLTIAGLAFDKWQVKYFIRDLDNAGVDSWIYEPNTPTGYGIKLLRHGQGYAGGASDSELWMPRSIMALENAVAKGQLTVHKNPVLTWNSASAVLAADPTGNKKWEKRKSTGRIDGIVALCQAVGALLAADDTNSSSIYDEQGIMFL